MNANIHDVETLELINIEWEFEYVSELDDNNGFVSDCDPMHEDIEPYSLDEEGVPIGSSKYAFKARQSIIANFWHELKEKYKTPEEFRVYNVNLNEYIYLRAISFIEAKEHSAKNNLSTRAFLRVEEVLANARPVARLKTKEGDSNQKAFDQMLIMTHYCDGIGRVKLTVGIKKKKDANEQKTEYSLTYLPDGTPLISSPSTKKASRK